MTEEKKFDENPETNLTTEDIEALRLEAKRLADVVDTSYFELGGVLNTISESGCYTEWGHDTFGAFVESDDLGFARRKAFYLMMIHEQSEKLGVGVDDLRGVGWSKAKEFLPICETRSEFDVWADKAKKLSLKDITKEVKLAKGADPDAGKDAEGNKITTNPETGETFHILTFSLADKQYENVLLAIQKAKEMGKSESKEHLIDMIALDFLSHNATFTDLAEKLADWFVQDGDLNVRIAEAVNAKLLKAEDDETE